MRDPRDRIKELEQEVTRLREDRDRWKQQSERLQEQLDAARRAGKRQAAPFAKDQAARTRRASRTTGRHGLREAWMPPPADPG